MERKKRRVISEECKQKVVELRKGGLTYKEIAQLCGLYRADHARQICEKAGFLKTNAEMRNEQIFALRKDGLLYDEISERLNVPKGIVQRVCNTNGFSYSREEQSKVAHKWSVNNQTKYYDSSVEKIKNRIPDYMEYIGGYDGSAGYVTIRCKDCGAEFERSVQAIRKKQVKYCPVCRERETKKNREEREQIRNAKRIERETAHEERLKQAEAERKEKTVEKTCVVCGRTFETVKQRAKCCSEECSRRYASHHRDRRIPKDKRISYGINAKSLFKRDDGTCWICGGKCNLNDYVIRDGAFIAGDWYPSVDHVIAICDGGEDSWNNVKLAHRICNTRRYYAEKQSPDRSRA